MNTKYNIGDKVLIEVTVKEIRVYEDGRIEYYAVHPGEFGMTINEKSIYGPSETKKEYRKAEKESKEKYYVTEHFKMELRDVIYRKGEPACIISKTLGLPGNFNAMEFRVDSMGRDIGAAKSMAQTAKQRTEVDYTKCSKEKSDADVVQEVYNRMVGRGATREELDTFRNLIQKYDALEKKEIPVVKKTCETCKYCDFPRNCDAVVGMCINLDKWEAKDNA